MSTFNLDGRAAHPVAWLQHLIGRGGETVDADQKVFRLAARDALLEELLDGATVGDFDFVREAATMIVDKEHFHAQDLSKK